MKLDNVQIEPPKVEFPVVPTPLGMKRTRRVGPARVKLELSFETMKEALAYLATLGIEEP